MLDLNTNDYFFAPKEIKQELRKTKNPVVDLQSSIEPTQTESQNALRVKEHLSKKILGALSLESIGETVLLQLNVLWQVYARTSIVG